MMHIKSVVKMIGFVVSLGLCMVLCGCDDEVEQLKARNAELSKQLLEVSQREGNLRNSSGDEVQSVRKECEERVKRVVREYEAERDVSVKKARAECDARVAAIEKKCKEDVADMERRLKGVEDSARKDIAAAKEESARWKKDAEYWKDQSGKTGGKYTALWWSLPLLLILVLGGGTFLGLRTRADVGVQKSSTNRQDI